MSARQAIILPLWRQSTSIKSPPPRVLVASTRCLSCYCLSQHQLQRFNNNNNNISSSSSSSANIINSHVQTPSHASLIITRSFAVSNNRRNDSRGAPGNNSSNNNNNSNTPLANEHLVSALMRRFQVDSAEEVQVRVLMDTSSNKNNKRDSDGDSDSESSTSSSTSSSVTTLAQAIQTSITSQQDLFEVALHQDVPVLRIACLQTLQYQKAKSASNKKQQQKINKINEPKEFRFNAKIADNDLVRKANQMMQALSKQYICMITVSCKGWQARQEPGLLQGAVDRVLSNLPADSYEITQPLKQFHAGMVKLSIRPSQKLKQEQNH